MNEAGPLVIGGTGGSGTRLLARLAQSAGVFLGAGLNESEDQLEIADFCDRWINRWLAEGPACETQMEREIAEILARHRRGHSGPWGWKEPRSIYLLEFFDRILPETRFLHVVRDGRDMAYSTNQNQLRKHGEAMLGTTAAVEPRRSIELWAEINGRAADYGERHMGERYVRLRFEDLLEDPLATAARLEGTLGTIPDPAVLSLERPRSLAAWRGQRPDAVHALEAVARTALTRFGYIEGKRVTCDTDPESGLHKS